MPNRISTGETSATLLVLGASHHTSTVDRLESFARGAERLRRRFEDSWEGGSEPPIKEMTVLATCNRVEIYAIVDPAHEDTAARVIASEVFVHAASVCSDVSYQLRDADAIRHLARVASGLDSVVVGEHQISGQVTRAFVRPSSWNGEASVLRGVGRIAARASGRVRHETELGRHSASLGTVALDLARDELGDLEGRDIVVVGAGKVGSLVCSALGRAGASRITVVNRSVQRAREIAEGIGAETATLDKLPELLERASVVITATTAEEPTIDETTVKQSLPGRASAAGPLLIIDLAIPRDVDPGVAELEGIRLLTLDDVKSRLDRHMSLRLGEVGPAEAVVDDVVDAYLHSSESAEVEGLITQLRRTAEQIRDQEVGRWLGSVDGAVSQEDVDRLTRSIVNKLFHTPMVRLRGAEELNGRQTDLLSAVSELFDLSKPGEPSLPE